MKRLLLIVIVLLAVAAAAVLAGYLYLSAQDAEQVRLRAESGLEAALGRDVSLKGPLKVSLTPLPAITISDVSVANAPWGTRPEMLTVGELQLVPALVPLLVGRIELREVRISAVQLFLENSPDGKGNWQFKPTGSNQGTGLPVRIHTLAISDLHAAYSNPDAHITREIELDELLMTAGSTPDEVQLEAKGQVLKQALAVNGRLGRVADLMEGRPFPIEIRATIGDTSLSISGQIDDPDFRDYKGIHLHFSATGRRPVVLMGWTDINMPVLNSFSLAGDLEGKDGDLGLQNFQSHLTAEGYDLKLAGAVADLPQLEGLAIDFDGTADTITQMLPWSEEAFTAKGRFAARGHLSGDKSAPRLDSVTMTGQIPGVDVEIDGSVMDLHDGGKVDARIKLRAQGLAAVGQRLHVTLPDLDAADIDARLSGTLLAPTLQDVQATLTEGTLSARVAGAITEMIPGVSMDVTVDLSGADLADLGSLLGYQNLPHTDSVKASGRLQASKDKYALSVSDGLLARRDGTELRVSGSIDDIGARARLDVAMELSGTDLATLPQVKAAGLPDTDKFRIRGRLQGPIAAPDLVDVDAQAWLEKITVTVQGQFPDVLKFEQMDARVDVEGEDLAFLGKQFNQRWPVSRDFRFGGQVHGNTRQPSLDGLQGRLGTDQVQVSFSGRVHDVAGGKGFDLQVQASATSLAVFFPLGGHAWDALGASDARFTIKGDADRYHVNLAELHAGKSSFTGQFTYSRAAPDQPRKIEGAFQESVLDLTPWLQETQDTSADVAGAQAATTAQTKPVFPPTPFDLEWMKSLQLDVDLSAVELAAGQDRIELVHGKLGLADGRLALDPMQLNYQGADITGTLELSDAPTPRLAIQTVTRDLNFGQLARRAGLSEDARGTIDMKFDLEAQGASAAQMAASADGQVMMLMSKGFVGGKQLPLHFGEIFVHLLPGTKNEDGIAIKCSMLDMPIKDGVATIQLFVLNTAQMLMRGKGTVDLGKETYDILLVPRAKHAKALAHNVDVRIVGKLGHPEIRYDATAAGINALETVGRVALLGPAGLFLNPEYFRSQRQECAESLEQVQQMQ